VKPFPCHSRGSGKPEKKLDVACPTKPCEVSLGQGFASEDIRQDGTPWLFVIASDQLFANSLLSLRTTTGECDNLK
jgi:hypothetical protein